MLNNKEEEEKEEEKKTPTCKYQTVSLADKQIFV